MQLPHPFPFLLLSSFLHPSSSHTLLHAVLTAASETRLGIPEQVWCCTQRKGIHILQEAHRLQIYIESCSVSITVLLRVTYRGLTTKTIVSPSKSHTVLNSQIKNQPRVIWSWEWHPAACKKRSDPSTVQSHSKQAKASSAPFLNPKPYPRSHHTHFQTTTRVVHVNISTLGGTAPNYMAPAPLGEANHHTGCLPQSLLPSPQFPSHSRGPCASHLLHSLHCMSPFCNATWEQRSHQ